MARPRYLKHLDTRPETEARQDSTFITILEFGAVTGLSRRQIHRLRSLRPPGFPVEYELGTTASKYRRTPRFKLAEVLAWMESRAMR